LIQVLALELDVGERVVLALEMFGAGVFSPAGHLPKRVKRDLRPAFWRRQRTRLPLKEVC